MVVPSRILTPELAQLIMVEALKRGIDPKELIVGRGTASVNPATGEEEFGLFSERASKNQTGRNPEEQQLSLGWVERQMIPKSVEQNVRGALNRLTGEELSNSQQDRLYNDVIRNINRGNALKFQSINPKDDPMSLTSEQCAIVRGELKTLYENKSPVASAADEQFRKVLQSGRVVCP